MNSSSTCFVRTIRHLIKYLHKPRNGRPGVILEFVVEMPNAINASPLHTARSTAQNFGVL